MKLLSTGYSPFTLTLILTCFAFSACSHVPHSNRGAEEVEIEVQKAREERFIAQALEVPIRKNPLIAEFKNGLFAEEKRSVLEAAKSYLATDHSISFSELSSSFSEEQGLAFLEHLRNTLPALFARPGEKRVLEKLDQALAESTAGSGEIHLISSPELVTHVRQLANLSPELAKVAYEVEMKIGIPAVERRKCSEFNEKKVDQYTRVVEWFRLSGALANEVFDLKPIEPAKCFLEATANRFTAYLNDVELAKNLVSHCGLANSGSLNYFQSMTSGGAKPEVSLARLRNCRTPETHD